MTHPRMEQIQALWDKHVYFAEREDKITANPEKPKKEDIVAAIKAAKTVKLMMQQYTESLKPQPYRPFRWRLDGKAPIVVDKKGRKIK